MKITANVNLAKEVEIEPFYVLRAIKLNGTHEEIVAKKTLEYHPCTDEIAQFLYENSAKANYCSIEMDYRICDDADAKEDELLPFSDVY